MPVLSSNPSGNRSRAAGRAGGSLMTPMRKPAAGRDVREALWPRGGLDHESWASFVD